MPSLKEVRSRITSVTSTRQITSAMKLVSAAKLRRAQDAITKMKPYALKLKEILENVSQSVDAGDNVYAQQREEKVVTLIVVTSNRGLCGAFNASVIKQTMVLINTVYKTQAEAGNLQIITIGKKATSYFARRSYPVIGSFDDLYNQLSFENVIPVAEMVMDLFKNKKTDKVAFIYNQFKTAASQQVSVEQFLPVEQPETEDTGKLSKDYIFEPNKEEILNNLIPISLKTQFFKVLLDSYAAEHGARMTSMHKATDNAGEILKQLKLTYNKARQAAITNEILEIVAGAEALKG